MTRSSNTVRRYKNRSPAARQKSVQRFLDWLGVRTPDDLAAMRDRLRKSNDPRDHRTADEADRMIQEMENE